MGVVFWIGREIPGALKRILEGRISRNSCRSAPEPALSVGFPGNCRSGPPACSGPVRSSPEGPPPAFRTGRFLWRHGQGFRHGLELFHKLLVTPVGVGQSFAVQVHHLAEAIHLNLEGEVLCPGFVSDVLTDFRKVTIGVTSGDLSDVFDFVIHEDQTVCRWPCCSVSVVSSLRLIIRSRVDLETFSLAAASFLVTLTTLMSSLCSGYARRYQRR